MKPIQSTLKLIYDALRPSYEGQPKKIVYEEIARRVNDLAGKTWTWRYIQSVLSGTVSPKEEFVRVVTVIAESLHGEGVMVGTEDVVVRAKFGTLHSGAVVLASSKPCKNPSCTVYFVPKQSGQKYCSQACRKHNWWLRKQVKMSNILLEESKENV